MKLTKPDLLLGILVTVIWGCNFAVIELGLQTLDPYSLALLRFIFCAFPLVFLVKRPKGVSWGVLAAYGILFGGGLGWGLNFALHMGLSPGMSSVFLQTSAFFTILLSGWLLGERVLRFHIYGMCLGSIGLLLILQSSSQMSTVLGVVLVLSSAFAWACCNLLVKLSKPADIMAFVAWSSLFSIPTILLLIVIGQGGASLQGLTDGLTPTAVFSVFFQSYVTTLFGYGCWNSLMKKYPAVRIAPLSLLVPVSGLAASALMFGEQMTAQQAWAIAFLLLGVAVFLNAQGLQALRSRQRWKA